MNYTDDFSFVNQYLLPGEYITWKGKPEKGLIFTGQDIFMIPFSLLWLAFALFWEIGVIESGIPFMILWGLPFIGVGLYMLAGRYIHKAWLRPRTFYVITNKKLIVKRGNKLTMYTAMDLPPMTLRIHKNGNGTIGFSEIVHYGSKRHTNYFALENLKEAVRAQNAISSMER